MILYAAARRRLAQAAPLAVLVPVLVALWALRDQLPTALPPNPPAPASDPVISGHPALLALRRSAPSASGSRPSCSDARPRAAPLGFIRVSRGAPKPLIGVSGAVRDRVVGERAPQPCAVLEVPPFLVEYDEAMSVHRVVQQSTQIADRPRSLLECQRRCVPSELVEACAQHQRFAVAREGEVDRASGEVGRRTERIVRRRRDGCCTIAKLVRSGVEKLLLQLQGSPSIEDSQAIATRKACRYPTQPSADPVPHPLSRNTVLPASAAVAA